MSALRERDDAHLFQPWDRAHELCESCGRRESEHLPKRRRASPARPSEYKPQCNNCGMNHEPDDKSACIEGHGLP